MERIFEMGRMTIARRPEACLLAAAATGVFLGWMVKRK